MIRKPTECVEEIRKEMRGGTGEVSVLNLVTQQELLGKGRLFAKITLKPGCSIGYHLHETDSEIYYITKGTALYHDGDTPRTVVPGDVLVTPVGGGHAVENPADGKEDVELIALIVYA